jgi:mono/diheme cytochrome c family protein
VVAGPQDFVANLEISRGPEPESHLNPNWIALHRDTFDSSCAACHTVDNPGGTDNSSFCSNSACHGSAWEYAGFDAPSLREILSSQMPEATIIAESEPTRPTDVPTSQPEETQQTPTPQVAETEAAADAVISYESAIGPLLSQRCGGCHGESPQVGLDVTSYESLMKGSEAGAVILPTDPENSLIVEILSGEVPHFSQLSPTELALLVEWIELGALER